MKMMRVLAMVGVVCGLVGAGVAAVGQGGANPTRDDKAVTNGAPSSVGKRAITFADLMAMKRVSDPQISPSGKWVMFSVTDVSLEKNTKVNHLWVVGLNPSSGGGTDAGVLRSAQNDNQEKQNENQEKQNDNQKERQVTFGAGESFGRFSPDGKTISLTMKDQIFEMPWDDAKGTVGDAIQVTNVEGGADGAVWSPDSKRLMFVASVWPECSVKGSDPSVGGGTNTGVLRSAQNDASIGGGAPGFGAVVGGTRDVAAWKNAEPVGWAEEDACDKAENEAADKTPVKGQVWEGLLYRHWEHWTGAQRSHVLVVDADSGRNLRDLTPANVVGDAEVPTFFVGGVQNYAWAPDSKEIAYVANLDAVPAASTNNDVFTLRLDEAGAKAVKVSTSPGSDDGPAYSPDGKWLAFRSQARAGFESDKFRLMLLDREKKTIKEVLPNFDRWVDEFTWAPDSKAMYFASGDTGLESVLRTSVPYDGLIVETLSGEYSEVSVSPDGITIVASKVTVASPTEIYSLTSLSSTEFAPKVSRHFESGAPVDTNPPDRAGAILGTSVESQLTHVNGGLLAKLDLAPLESFWLTGAGGTKVQGFILRPPGFDAAKKYPVKFLMHGGPQTAWGDAWSYRWNWELMAASGYVVIGINRRGSTGYGQKFVDEVSGDWGGRAYEDLMKGLDYAEAHYSFIDKTRECALGASYGGFMADWVLTHTNRFKCIVTHDGLYDPVAGYGSTEELWFNEWEFRRPEDFPKGWDGFGGSAQKGKTNTEVLTGGQNDGQRTYAGVLRSAQNDKGKGAQNEGSKGDGRPAQPWRYAGLAADQDPFRKWAPVRFIENAKTPTLVIHSQRDYRLDVSQGMELFTALQRLGVPSKMLYFPDEGHWILKPQNSELWNAEVSDWCDRWTKTGKYAESR